MCPTCGTAVIAKCGDINSHHWAHESREDCDAWSENIGPWHLEWQNLVDEQYVEIAIGPHRADIVGNSGLVVELQHSPIPADHIEAREEFYGDMIWLFDATQRFPCVPSGDRVFFSLQGTKHIGFCKKNVFFDCGDYVVEVEQFTDIFDKFSGYGRLRDRGWFASSFLSQVLKAGSKVPTVLSGRLRADFWRGKKPWRLTNNPSRWRGPASGSEFLIPAKSVFLPMSYKWRGHLGPVWSDVISGHPEIANGWTDAALTEMQSLLTAVPMILDGRLRLMPAPAQHMRIEQSAAAIRLGIARAEEHMQAGRIPLLKPRTLEQLVARAEAEEIAKYGKSFTPARTKQNAQRDLF